MKRITVASYNIRHGADASFDMSKIASCILRSGADVVGFQEVDVGTTRVGGKDLVEELKQATGYKYGYFVKSFDYKGGGYGNAILSRFPVLSFDRELLYFTDRCEQRSVGICKIDADGHVFNFAVTHLDLVSDDVRRTQLREINALLEGKGPYFLTGDFNTQNFSLFDEFPEGNIILDDQNKLVTFPGASITIDNIVYHNSITLLEKGTETESYSDHYMLWGTFEIA